MKNIMDCLESFSDEDLEKVSSDVMLPALANEGLPAYDYALLRIVHSLNREQSLFVRTCSRMALFPHFARNKF